ncbi:aldose epimerase family protein [Oscillibacter sp.]|uniref:aldose epimerase family protein n=1 Tax=Oscillibacter sp. TaxID=1945593 RepID=UPI0026071A47|nr:aldose epimerase family protein [Oscillibacter sp.]MDD3347653.1 galactose mutarotase [Oscillibacter sp.]
MALTQIPFGTTQAGAPVTAFCLTNRAGASVTLLDYGATIQALRMPDRQGSFTDVVLGYDTLSEYERGDGYLGATIGRVCNRIGGAAFQMHGKCYPLAKNDGENHLHGGWKGFDKYLWHAAPQGEDALCFSRLSPNGEEGYPGNLHVQVTFRLTEENALEIVYDADADQDTPVCLTNHSYFNLSGGGCVSEQQLQVSSHRITESDAHCLPTGRFLPVAGTALDFRTSRPLAAALDCDDPLLRAFGGCDHNFVLDVSPAASLYSPETGIEMTVETDLPGMQVYTANGLTSRAGKGGASMGPHGAVCLETQLFPNAMGFYAFPSPVLHAGEHLHSTTVYAFHTR